MHFKSLFTLLVLSLFIGCSQTTLIPETPQIIPVPNSIGVIDQVCILDKDFNLSVDSELSESADFLNEFLNFYNCSVHSIKRRTKPILPL